MIPFLTRFYHRLASPWVALIFTAPAIVLGARLMGGNAALPPGMPTIIDLQLAFTPDRFQSVLAAWGDALVHQFIVTMWMDYLYAACYALALASWLAWLSRTPHRPPARWALILFALPLVAGLADWMENTLHTLMVGVWRAAPAGLVFLASLAASIKWGAALISLAAFFALLIRRCILHTHFWKGRTMKKVLLTLLIILLILPIVLIAFLYVGVIRPTFPQLDGELQAQGLTAPVTIQRDATGIPHITAQNPHDLFFAQGFVHAQDRFWQMESARRAAHGTLSEVIGERGLRNDTFMRILGMTEAAQADWDTLDADTQAALEAYTAGVNAWLAQGKRPLELKILGVEPEPWTPLDSLVFLKLVAWGLSNNYKDELVVSQLAPQLDWDELMQLLPEYPGPDVIPDANRAASAETSRALLAAVDEWEALLPLARPDQGSNTWVAGGSHTASGLPLLANDPHQTLTMPGLWYEVGLHTTDGAYDVVGGSLPGAPGIEIGHNAHIAWGVTNARPDVQDLFIETLNEDGTQYQFQGEWRDITVREEVIQVKKGEPVTLKVRSTHHGPIVTDATPDAPQAMALRWTGNDQGRPLAQAILELNRASNWNEFRQALGKWQVPGLNFVYGDVEGNIGYQMTGAVPVRANNDVFGLLPVSGADGKHEWTGFIPFDEMPSDFNPQGDFYASANNRPVGPDYPYFLSHYFQPPYRVVRITERLRGSQGLTREDFQQLQADWYSDINRQVAQAIAADAQADSELQQQAQALLRDWDGVMGPDSQAAALSEIAMWSILRQAVSAKLDEEAASAYLTLAAYPYMFLQQLLDDPQNPWWQGRRQAILTQALADAVAELGEDPNQWAWGKIHQMTFSHPLGSVGPLRPIFNRGPYPTGGNWNTVDSGAYFPDKPYAMTLGPAYRIISDPSNWDASVSITPHGQSGQPFTKHYDDQIDAWLAVRYHPLPFTSQAIDAAAVHTLTLRP